MEAHAPLKLCVFLTHQMASFPGDGIDLCHHQHGNPKSHIGWTCCREKWWGFIALVRWTMLLATETGTERELAGWGEWHWSANLYFIGKSCSVTLCLLRRHATNKYGRVEAKLHAFLTSVDYVWNVMAHAQKPDFVFRLNRRVHLNRWGRQFSWLLAAEVFASAVIMLDTPCSVVVWRVLDTHSIRQFSLYFPSCALPSHFN
jgi:hypothetical protein